MVLNDSKLEKLNRRIRKCRKCGLLKTRTRAVPGEGPINAEIMLIGEAPGKKEDLSGRPFIGMAGKFLNKTLNRIGLKREKLFITSILKCRPPKNRLPKKEEILKCSRYLDEQIMLIKPKIICTLGNVALKSLIGDYSISKIHGKIIRLDKKLPFPLTIPTFHPAAAMRNRRIASMFEKDMKRLKLFQ